MEKISKSPVIGIISQRIKKDDPSSGTYIRKGYVDYMHNAGAEVVPIIKEEHDDETIKYLVQRCNGILFPGGKGYSDFGKKVFKEVIRLNNAGQVYPMLGICAGFQYFTSYTAEGNWAATIDKLTANNEYLKLEFQIDPDETEFYSTFNASILAKKSYTFNYHTFGVKKETYEKDQKLAEFWKVTATSTSRDKVKFVASIEAKNYPFYATQYHPEKQSTEFKGLKHKAVNDESKHLTAAMADFFVSKAKKNNNCLESEIDKWRIENYKPVFSKGRWAYEFKHRMIDV